MIHVWLKALRQEYLDLTLRVSATTTARIIERPGKWMSEAQIADLLTELRSVARRTLPDGDLSYGILSGDRERLDRAVVTILHDTATKQPVAFNALSVMENALHGRPVDVIHMGLVMVDPTVRSQGFSWVLYGLTCLMLFAREQLRPTWLSNVTQVPAIVGMVSDTFSDVFPSPAPTARRSFEHLLLARQIMQHHRYVFGVGQDAGFDEQRFIITNAYTGGSDDLKKTFDQAPKHRETHFNEFCARELDYDRGDDVLQLCRLDLAAAKRFVFKNIPSRSLPGVLGALAFISLNRLALPLIYWFSADRPWGILRARSAPPAR